MKWAVTFLLVTVLAQLTAEAAASPPASPFSPPTARVPSLHVSSGTPVSRHPVPAPQPASASSEPQEGWEMLRQEPLAGGTGSPASQSWRWLLGLVVALVLIRWGLPYALRGGSKGQVAHWLNRLAPPKGEGTITILDSRLLGASALHLVAVRGRVLLIGSTSQQVSLLMDVTEQPETASAFDQVLSQAKPFSPEPTLQEEMRETTQMLEVFQQRLQAVRERLAS
ncbi:MAG: flagellar biosynthetic protein FliO [Armatimonadota bacterium]|nr:flagellar biosynthetic protein FliO [Armatimonadota bacterium]